MDIQKLQARAELERMVYNYALLGIIDNGIATGIVSFIRNMVGGGERPGLENNIIYFPAPAGMQAPAPAEHPAPEADPMPPFSEYRETFRKLGITAPKNRGTIYYSLYALRIRSLEELAETPPGKIRRRGIGPKTYETIRNVLESNGITSEVWGIPETAPAGRQEDV
jgi:hypothetical protein